MTQNRIPEFAVVGHPNEGKSSIVSTLSEDDSVRISPYPGETVVCQVFPVVVDGKEIIRFTDTPGFQNPKKILAWMRNHKPSDNGIVHEFRKAHAGNPSFKEDYELFEPIERGAGIIYVADGSKPVRQVDLVEMEIFRLTGMPRMAIINCKEDEVRYLEEWKNEFRKHFNVIRVFNAHTATYAERIDLLESLKSIDQDLSPPLDTVITAFKADWKQRASASAEIICNMLGESLELSMTVNYPENTDEDSFKDKLRKDFNQAIEKIETKAYQNIRRLYKHNIFNYELPTNSIMNEVLFSKKTWQFLGLTPRQLATAAGITGGAIGAGLDIAAAGLTFGVFTALGGLLGAGWAAFGGGKRLAKIKVVGISLGGLQMKIGPIRNIQFMYILLDRALLFYSHIINWAHGRRDSRDRRVAKKDQKIGYTTGWDREKKGRCNTFYNAILKNDSDKKIKSGKILKKVLENELLALSLSRAGQGPADNIRIDD